MGDIDLDPASCAQAQDAVRARRFFTKEQDGLRQEWAGRVFLNPPYAARLITPFVRKLVASYVAGDVQQAILLTNSAGGTGWFNTAWDACSAVAFTAGRISFIKMLDGERVLKNSPTQGQSFFYFGPNTDAFGLACQPFANVVTCTRTRKGVQKNQTIYLASGTCAQSSRTARARSAVFSATQGSD